MDYQGTLIAVKDIEKAKDFLSFCFWFESNGGCWCPCSIDRRGILTDDR